MKGIMVNIPIRVGDMPSSSDCSCFFAVGGGSAAHFRGPRAKAHFGGMQLEISEECRHN